jgi:RNA polymerase sigma-70 factor (ECF subfamily)
MNSVMDESRFRALFDATYPALARYARHRGLDRDDAEDLIASTFEVAWRRLDVVPSDDEALLWLYAVAFNLLRNLRRRQGRDRQLVARLPMVDTVLPSSEPSTITTEAAQLGVVFNCSAIAARTRLYRARNRLAELLGFERGVQRLTPSRHEQVENDKPWEALR